MADVNNIDTKGIEMNSVVNGAKSSKHNIESVSSNKISKTKSVLVNKVCMY